MPDETVEEQENPRKAAAIALAARGFHVLPVDRQSKRPDKLLAPGGFTDATLAAAQIAAWFDLKPRCNVGIACGAAYGLLVLDVDVKGDAPGLATMQALPGLEGCLTLTARTPSGGYHFYFKHPGVPLKPTLAGLDIKGAAAGGYVLAPPSALPAGEYAYLDEEVPVAELPTELLAALRAPDAKAAKTKSVKGANDTIGTTGPVASIKTPQGRRHARLVELAAVFRGKGLGQDEIELLLWHHATTAFDPPFDRDSREDAREIEALLRWAGGKQPNDTAAGTPAPTTFNAERARVGLATFTEPQPAPVFIIDGVLPRDVCLQSAPGGSSKSTLKIWEAIHIILKRDFLGHAMLKPGPVLIVTAEDPLPRIKYRAHHMAAQMNLSEQELETLGEQLLVEDMTGQVCRLAALAQDGNLYQTVVVDHLIAAYEGAALAHLVLDPLVLFGPGERLVNDGDAVMAQVGARLVRELSCAVTFIAHSGKANAREGRSDQYASRGGSAMPDGMRMVQVLTVVGPKDTDVPDAVDAEDVAKGRILRITIPKITDAPPFTEPFYVRRYRHSFEWIENAHSSQQERQLRHIATIQSFIKTELLAGVRHTQTSLENCTLLGLSRNALRQALHAALERGFILARILPQEQRGRGGKKHYLVIGATP